MIHDLDLDRAIEDLEALAGEAPVMSAAAVYILKNELDRIDDPEIGRELIFHRRFHLPEKSAPSWRRLRDWLSGRDAIAFRDRCDRAFWEQVVPVIEAQFGELADLVMNTVNEAVINYAEYSFRPWSLGRRVMVDLFLTEGNLAYTIIRPSGTRLAVFDPLELKEKSPETLLNRKRGWGHTILMRRALFVSFDHQPRRRGMMIVLGADENPVRGT